MLQSKDGFSLGYSGAGPRINPWINTAQHSITQRKTKLFSSTEEVQKAEVGEFLLSNLAKTSWKPYRQCIEESMNLCKKVLYFYIVIAKLLES